MDTFATTAKQWPDGTDLHQGIDSTDFSGEDIFFRAAPEFVVYDGKILQFLFWNTGRHITNKLNVKWMFRGGWGIWRATRWYGIPNGNGGPPRVHADGFSIGDDTAFTDTPINGRASTYAPGAWPFNQNDHEIGTAAGPATVVPQDPFHDYEFAEWIKLIYGGDPTGEFVETDADIGGIIGGPTFFRHALGGAANFSANINTSADLLAGFGYHDTAHLVLKWEQVRFKHPLFIPVGDPALRNLVRLGVLQQVKEETQSGSAAGISFQQLIEATPKMSREELMRATQSVETALELGKTALKTLEARRLKPAVTKEQA